MFCASRRLAGQKSRSRALSMVEASSREGL
jgi:hypothetical protein